MSKAIQKVKVLLLSVSINKRGGVSNYTNLLLNNIDSAKYDINYFEIGRGARNPNFLFLPLILLKQIINFKNIIEKNRPDVIHINMSIISFYFLYNYLFFAMAKAKKIPVLFFIRGWRPNFQKILSEKKLISFFIKFWFIKVDRFLVLSENFKNILRYIGVLGDKITVTNTMVDTKKLNIRNSPKKNNSQNILCCGRIKKAKGVYELLEAIPKVVEKYPNVNFFFMGNESRIPNKVDLGLLLFKKKVKSMNLEKNVKLTGYVSGLEKLKYYNISDIYVLPSYSEGLPNVFCESMAAGLPFISTSVGGLADSVIDGKNGFLLKSLPPIPNEITEKILYLLDNPELIKEMSKNSLQIAKEKYDVNTVCNKMGLVYKEVINSGVGSSNY